MPLNDLHQQTSPSARRDARLHGVILNARHRWQIPQESYEIKLQQGLKQEPDHSERALTRCPMTCDLQWDLQQEEVCCVVTRNRLILQKIPLMFPHAVFCWFSLFRIRVIWIIWIILTGIIYLCQTDRLNNELNKSADRCTLRGWPTNSLILHNPITSKSIHIIWCYLLFIF